MLRVPDVEPGDVGMLLTIHGFLHDVSEGQWWITCDEQRRYRLPPDLNEWAARTEADVTRRFITLPKVFAFSSINGNYCVRLMPVA